MELMQAIKHYIPSIATILCVIGIIFGIVMVVLLSIYGVDKKEEKHEEIKQRTARDMRESLENMETEEIPFVSDYLAKILAKLGIIKFGPIIASFIQVMNILKASTFERHWRYRLPMYLVVGPKGSGKSSMLNGLPFMHLTGEQKIVEDVWHLFDSGVLFEVPANIFFDKDTKFWKFLLRVFAYFRPRRPLDGVILTLPADILGENHKTDIMQYARETVFKMSVLQKELNFRVPIYIVITKSDVISGFSAFCTELAPSEKGQIIGWSSKENIDAEIKKNMVSEAMNEIAVGLRRASLLFARDKRVSPVLKNAIFIKTSMDLITKDLEEYISILINQADKDLFLCLRGVYFVSMNTTEVTDSHHLEMSALDPNNIENKPTEISVHDMHRGVCFADDLFREKIFKEMNLARPLDMSTLQVSKQTWIKRGVALLLSAIWSVGWYTSNEAIMKEVKSAERILRNAVNLLKKINVIEDDVRDHTDQQILKQETKKMLQLISNINKDNLSSLFVPASWFSDIKIKISSVVGLLFDSSATKTIFLDLNLNAKLASYDLNKPHDSLERNKNPFDVSQLPSFAAFKEFIHKVIKLEKMEAEYNRIRKLDDPESINLITNEIFQETFNVTHMLQDRPTSSRYVSPRFNLDQFKDQLISDSADLFERFLDDVFNNTINLVFQKLCEDIDQLMYVAQNNQETYSYHELSMLLSKLDTLSRLASSNSFAWIKAPSFKPTDEYTNTMALVETSKVLGHKVARLLKNIASEKFIELKKSLGQYSSVFTGKIFAGDSLTLSKGFESFRKEIRTIIDEVVVDQEFLKEFTTEIPADQILLWDTGVVSEAAAKINKYHNFIDNRSKKFRDEFRDAYASIIRKMIYPDVIATLARAQNLEDINVSASSQQLESVVRKQAINLKGIMNYVSKISLFFDEYTSRGLPDCGFSALIIEQANSVLNVVDALFEIQSPYAVGQSVFSQWNGQSGPNFGMGSDSNDIKQYLTSQFQRMRFLAKELASPAIDILDLPGITDKVSDFNKKAKWADILKQVEGFENNVPGNSIAALEDFMAKISENASAQTLRNDVTISSALTQSGDYFINQKAKIAKSLMDRASDITFQQAYDEYNNIANFFNSQLAGKFPFNANSQENCTVDELKNFIETCNSLNKDTINTLKKNASKYDIPLDAINFIESIPALTNFLSVLILHNTETGDDNAAMSYKIETRANMENESFGNVISERSFLVNGVAQEEENNIIIHNGDTVEVELPFVMSEEDGELNVTPDQEITVNGDKVMFEYTGDWSILKLLQRRKVDAGPNGVLLAFEVPITVQETSNKAKVYMRIKSFFRDEGGEWMPLPYPNFPSTAPQLPTINF